MQNEAIPFYEDAKRITGHCKAAVTGKRFVAIAADAQGNTPGLSDDALGGNIVIQHAAAKAGRVLGVSSYDAAKDDKVTVLRGCQVVPVKAGVAMSAGQEVGVGAEGVAVKAEAPSEAEVKEGKLTKVPSVGYILADVAEGADAMVALNE